MPPGLLPLSGPGAIPSEWADESGFIVPPNSHDLWKVRLHGAFTIRREILDWSCHHEAYRTFQKKKTHEFWFHLDLSGDRYAHGSRRNHDRRVLFKDRSGPYPPKKEKGKNDGGSDHSLSSLSSTRDLMLP